MTIQKPLYLMSGGRAGGRRGYDPVMFEIAGEIGKESPVIAYVGVASGDDAGFFKMIGSMITGALKCKLVHALLVSPRADLNKARETLRSADAVFMSGGDVEAGMQVLEEKNLIGFFQDLYRQGHLFFGASAGAIMMAREWVRWTDPDDDSTAQMFPCLDLAPLICDTHAEEDDWEELKAALRLKPDKTLGYGIASASCLKVHPDGRLEALGGPVMQYQRRGEEIVQLADLRP